MFGFLSRLGLGFCVAFLIAGGSLFAVDMVLAQGGISITPLIMELDAQAGDRVERSVRIVNQSSGVYEVEFEAFDVDIERESHNVRFLPKESKQNTDRSLASWVEIEDAERFSLAKGEQLEFSFRIDIPTTTAPGDYYSSLNFYYTSPKAGEQFGAVQVRQSLGVLLLLSVSAGDESQVLEELNFSQPQVSTNGQAVQFNVDFRNNSLRYVSLKPVLTLLSAAGDILLESEGGSTRVFPGETTRLEHQLSAGEVLDEATELHYAFWDRRGEQQYYQGMAQLDPVQLHGAAPAKSLSSSALALFLSGLGLLLLSAFVWRRQKV